METKVTVLWTVLAKIYRRLLEGIFIPTAVVFLGIAQVFARVFPEKGEEPREGEEDLY